MTMHQWTLLQFAEERARTTSAVSAPGRGPDGNCGHIERFYNRRHLDQAMGYRSPEEFDQQEVELKATVPTLPINCFWMSDDMRLTFVGVTSQLRAVII